MNWDETDFTIRWNATIRRITDLMQRIEVIIYTKNWNYTKN